MQVVCIVIEARINVVQRQLVEEREIGTEDIIDSVLILDAAQSFEHPRFLFFRESLKLIAEDLLHGLDLVSRRLLSCLLWWHLTAFNCAVKIFQQAYIFPLLQVKLMKTKVGFG